MSLTPTHRIKLIQEISTRLGAENWPLIDLTLSQFELPTTEYWNDNDRSRYIVEMISKELDQKLIDLGKHVGYELGISPASVEPSYWAENTFRVFLSHLASYRVDVAKLQKALLPYGISCFVAHNDIEPTEEWQIQIETALSTCDALVALLHKDFHKSLWTDQEIGFAMGRGIPVFSVRYGETPKGFIGRYQAFNGLNKSEEELARELFEHYCKNKQSEEKMARILTQRFERSNSWEQAKINIYNLEKISEGDSSLAARIKIASETNDQIISAFGVPGRVENLLKKWKKESFDTK